MTNIPPNPRGPNRLRGLSHPSPLRVPGSKPQKAPTAYHGGGLFSVLTVSSLSCYPPVFCRSSRFRRRSSRRFSRSSIRRCRSASRSALDFVVKAASFCACPGRKPALAVTAVGARVRPTETASIETSIRILTVLFLTSFSNTLPLPAYDC